MSAFVPAAYAALAHRPFMPSRIGFLSRFWRALLASLAAASLIAAAQAQAPGQPGRSAPYPGNRPQPQATEPSIVGTWRSPYNPSGLELEMKYESTGTFTVTRKDRGRVTLSDTGTYSQDGQRILVRYSDHSTDAYLLRWENANACLFTIGGMEKRFTRVDSDPSPPVDAANDGQRVGAWSTVATASVNRLVGVWEATTSQNGKIINLVMRFDADGSFTFVQYGKEVNPYGTRGTYRFEQGQLWIQADGRTFVQTVNFLSPNQCQFANVPVTWNRVM